MPVDYSIPPWLTPQAAQGWGDLWAKGNALTLQAQGEANKVALEGARLSQAARQASLRHEEALANLAADKEARDKAALVEGQKIEVKKAYDDAQIGLAQQKIDAEAKQIAAQSLAQQNFAKDYQAAVGAGTSADEAYQAAILKHGPSLYSGTPGGGASFASALKPRQQSTALTPQLQPVLNPDGSTNADLLALQTGPGSLRAIPKNPLASSQATGSRLEKERKAREDQQGRMNELTDLTRQRGLLQTKLQRDERGTYSVAIAKQKAGKRLDADEKAAIAAHEEAVNKIAEIDIRIKELRYHNQPAASGMEAATQAVDRVADWDPKSKKLIVLPDE